MQKALISLLVASTVSLSAVANDGAFYFDPENEAVSSVEDDLERSHTYTKVGKFAIDRCYNMQSYHVHGDAFMLDDFTPSFCDQKQAAGALTKAAAQKANFNKNYVLYQHSFINHKEYREATWFALNKKTNKVALLPIFGLPDPEINKNPKLKYSLNSNRFCISTANNYDVVNVSDDFVYEPNSGKDVCFWLKEDKKGPYWSERPNKS